MLTKIDNYLLKKFGRREKIDINSYIIKYKTVWAIIFVLNLMDAFATLMAIRNSETHEINPIMNILLSSLPGFIIVKMTLVCVLFMIVYNYLSQFGRVHDISCWYIIIFFMLIDINNLVHVFILNNIIIFDAKDMIHIFI